MSDGVELINDDEDIDYESGYASDNKMLHNAINFIKCHKLVHIINCYTKQLILHVQIKCINVLLSSMPKKFIISKTNFVLQRRNPPPCHPFLIINPPVLAHPPAQQFQRHPHDVTIIAWVPLRLSRGHHHHCCTGVVAIVALASSRMPHRHNHTQHHHVCCAGIVARALPLLTVVVRRVAIVFC